MESIFEDCSIPAAFADSAQEDVQECLRESSSQAGMQRSSCFPSDLDVLTLTQPKLPFEPYTPTP